jgi:uncharacterized protein (DUF2062 family)
MIHLTRTLVRRWLDALLHIDDTPRRTAAAYALGVFCGFSPFLGLHTALGVALAFLFNLNRVAVILGVYSNLPWIIAPFYTGATMLGAALLRANLAADFGDRIVQLFELSVFHAEFWHRLQALISPLYGPFFLGSTLGAILLAAAAYPAALAFVRSRRKVAALLHKEKG